MGRNSIPPATRDWLVTGGLSVALIGGAFLWRGQQPPAPSQWLGKRNRHQAVGIFEWSASLHQPPLPEGIRITDSVMKRTLALMQTHAQNSMGAAWRSIWR
jgi:hypothetical protein